MYIVITYLFHTLIFYTEAYASYFLGKYNQLSRYKVIT